MWSDVSYNTHYSPWITKKSALGRVQPNFAKEDVNDEYKEDVVRSCNKCFHDQSSMANQSQILYANAKKFQCEVQPVPCRTSGDLSESLETHLSRWCLGGK